MTLSIYWAFLRYIKYIPGTATRVENCPHNGDEYELQISGHVFMIIWNLLFYTYTKMGSFFQDICLCNKDQE